MAAPQWDSLATLRNGSKWSVSRRFVEGLTTAAVGAGDYKLKMKDGPWAIIRRSADVLYCATNLRIKGDGSDTHVEACKHGTTDWYRIADPAWLQQVCPWPQEVGKQIRFQDLRKPFLKPVPAKDVNASGPLPASPALDADEDIPQALSSIEVVPHEKDTPPSKPPPLSARKPVESAPPPLSSRKPVDSAAPGLAKPVISTSAGVRDKPPPNTEATDKMRAMAAARAASAVTIDDDDEEAEEESEAEGDKEQEGSVEEPALDADEDAPQPLSPIEVVPHEKDMALNRHVAGAGPHAEGLASSSSGGPMEETPAKRRRKAEAEVADQRRLAELAESMTLLNDRVAAAEIRASAAQAQADAALGEARAARAELTTMQQELERAGLLLAVPSPVAPDTLSLRFRLGPVPMKIELGEEGAEPAEDAEAHGPEVIMQGVHFQAVPVWNESGQDASREQNEMDKRARAERAMSRLRDGDIGPLEELDSALVHSLLEHNLVEWLASKCCRILLHQYLQMKGNALKWYPTSASFFRKERQSLDDLLQADKPQVARLLTQWLEKSVDVLGAALAEMPESTGCMPALFRHALPAVPAVLE